MWLKHMNKVMVVLPDTCSSIVVLLFFSKDPYLVVSSFLFHPNLF